MMAIELELTAPVVAPKTVVDLAPTPASATSSIQHMPSIPYIADPSSPLMHVVPCNKGKGKAKAMEEDEDEEGEAAQKLRKELEDFVVPTKFDDKLLASLLPPPMEYYEGDIELLHSAKISGGRKGDITLVSPAMLALVLEKNGTVHGCLWNGMGVRMQKKHPPLEVLIIAKHVKLVQAAKAFLEWQGKSLQFFVLESFKGKGKAKALLVNSEQTGANNSNEEEEEERVHVIKKIKREHIEELIGIRKGKEIIELEDLEDEMVVPKTPIAGPLHQTLKPMHAQTCSQANYMDEDGNNDEDDEEGGKDDDDNDAAMDIDSGRHSEETWPTAPTKVMVTEVVAPAPVP
ncbi:hypothetical protein C0995_006760, partial [Termitomyces sp. Mi166